MVILLPQTLEFSILNFLPSPPCEGVIHGQILDVVMVWQEQWGVTISEVLLLNLHQPDLLFGYFSHHLTWHCSSNYEDVQGFAQICTDLHRFAQICSQNIFVIVACLKLKQ